MDWYEEEVQHLERLPEQGEGATVFYGGSSIRLWNGLKTDFPGCNVVNRGFGGATLAACLHFFDRLVAPLSPGALVLYAGDNDIGDGGSSRHVIDLFIAFQCKLDREFGHIPFTYLSIKPSPSRWHLSSTIREANAAIERLTNNYIDTYNPMLDQNGQPKRHLFCEDGLHLSEEGYKLWKKLLTNSAKEVFAGCMRPA